MRVGWRVEEAPVTGDWITTGFFSTKAAAERWIVARRAFQPELKIRVVRDK